MAVQDGLPSREEIAALGPPLFTWDELMDIVDGGDLGLLKRRPALQKRYDIWTAGIKEQHGTIENYLLTRRLCWSPPGLPSSSASPCIQSNGKPESSSFSPTTPPTHYRIARNDWPYSVPFDVEHFVIWSAVPLLPLSTASSDTGDGDVEREEVERKGMWGFTGGADLRADGPARKGFGGRAGAGITQFVKREWPEEDWETAWFMNPPKLQSVRGLVHFHVFGRPKHGRSLNGTN